MLDKMHSSASTRGGETVGLISNMSDWEVQMVLNFRCWVSDETGRNNVCNNFKLTFPPERAAEELWAFENFLAKIAKNSYYPLAHNNQYCPYLGAHEAILVHMVSLASSGFLLEASQIASLIALPSQAEAISLMAVRIGATMRDMVHQTPETLKKLKVSSYSIH